MEYVAMFLAVLFPGAMVALNYELLQSLPRFASLRIYCAGVWHNAAFCIVCVLALFLLPLMLDPFYIHGESPMVLDVYPTSPLSGYLSPRDLIISLGGTRIHTVQEWKETIALLNTMNILQNFKSSTNIEDFMTRIDRKGYCVPYYMIKESISTTLENNKTACPDEFYMFASTPCLDSHTLEDARKEQNPLQERGRICCFYPKDIMQLKKCGDGWGKGLRNRSSCSCLEDESCFSPIQMPGVGWVEITYLRPSKGCLYPRNSFQEYKSVDPKDTSCIHSFVFVGDLISLEHSLHLTSYQPRWEIDIGTYFPDSLEKLLICVFYVSLTLGFLNSFPVCFIQIIRYFSMFKFISLNHVIGNCYKFSLAFNWH